MSKIETVGVKINYNKTEPITFHLRLIGIAEESEFRQKLFGLPDKEKAEKAHAANVEFLADMSEAMPEGLFPTRPENYSQAETAEPVKQFIEDFKTPAELINKYFEDKSPKNERIAEYAVRGYFVAITPDVSFL